VIATLLYLAVQIRQNTRMAKAATRQALADGAQRLASDLVEVDDIARILQAHLDGAELKDHEVLRLQARVLRDFRFWDNALFQYREGLLTDDEWGSFRANLRVMLDVPIYRDYWKAIQSVFTGPFRTEVSRLLEEGPPVAYDEARRATGAADLSRSLPENQQ
jgi:hypothetical protein